MKKKLLTTIVLLMAFCFSGCKSYQSDKSIRDLSDEDISQITIIALTTGSMTKITDADKIAEILQMVKNLHLYVKADTSSEYTTDLVQYSIQKKSGEELTVAVLESKIAYNNEWYVCDLTTCSQISDLAYKYLAD